QRVEVALRHWRHLTPEALHLVAIEPLGAPQQLGRVGEVRGAALVAVDRQVGPAPDQVPGGAGVVEMDVGEQEGARLHAVQGLDQVLHRAGRAGVDEDAVDLPAADHPLPAEVSDVDEPHPGTLRAAGAARAPAAFPTADPSLRMTSAAARFPDW